MKNKINLISLTNKELSKVIGGDTPCCCCSCGCRCSGSTNSDNHFDSGMKGNKGDAGDSSTQSPAS